MQGITKFRENGFRILFRVHSMKLGPGCNVTEKFYCHRVYEIRRHAITSFSRGVSMSILDNSKCS